MCREKSIRFCFLLLFLAPYFLLLPHWNQLSFPPADELFWILKNSFLQSALSSALALLLGFWWARGLLFLEQKITATQNRLIEFLLLLPQLLPALFVLLILLSLISPFPFGLVGVVLVHGLLNASLVAIFLKDLFKNKLRSMAELCWVENAGGFAFWRESFRYLAADLFWIFTFVFILCFCSFSVPLIAGGGQAMTLEVLIFEKIRAMGNWNEAIGLSFLQLGFLFLFATLPAKYSPVSTGRFEKFPYLKSFSGAVSVLLFCSFWVITFFWQASRGFFKIEHIPNLWSQIFAVIPLSLVLSLAVGIFILVLLLLSAYLFPDPWLKKFFLSFVAPSTALLGFSLLFLPSYYSGDEFLKWIFTFVIFIFATLYRWGWIQKLESLRGQVQVASSMGASRGLIFKKILAPQIMRLACLLASVGSLWSLGDFAFAKIIIARPVTLALVAESLMSSYRIEAAMAVTLMILCLGLILLFFFKGVGHVACRKFE